MLYGEHRNILGFYIALKDQSGALVAKGIVRWSKPFDVNRNI